MALTHQQNLVILMGKCCCNFLMGLTKLLTYIFLVFYANMVTYNLSLYFQLVCFYGGLWAIKVIPISLLC